MDEISETPGVTRARFLEEIPIRATRIAASAAELRAICSTREATPLMKPIAVTSSTAIAEAISPTVRLNEPIEVTLSVKLGMLESVPLITSAVKATSNAATVALTMKTRVPGIALPQTPKTARETIDVDSPLRFPARLAVAITVPATK